MYEIFVKLDQWGFGYLAKKDLHLFFWVESDSQGAFYSDMIFDLAQKSSAKKMDFFEWVKAFLEFGLGDETYLN